jgi:MerR family transcriptional regulator, light-induced transcriptional regulator
VESQLTTRQVASALQVSESSVKRWCDAGVIPTVRTVGGHRRIPLDGLLEFLEATNRQLVRPEEIGLTISMGRGLEARLTAGESPELSEAITALREKFEEAVIVGDEKACRRVLSQWFAIEQKFSKLADELIAHTFHRLGELWSCQKLEVFEERRGCEICTQLLYELRRLIPEPAPNAPLAIGGSPEGDHYTLPSQMVEIVLRECGWRPSNLGVNLPLKTLAAAIRRSAPKMFWLSVSHIEDREFFLQSYREFCELIPKETVIVLGGRALDDRIRPHLRYTAHCDNLQQLARFATAMHGGEFNLKASAN